ncbi:MAG TPA: superoxide dismutase [Longimicrobiaceae bacterium]|nr:superoxide dismutase [Longimicrobiaceae bacterium]
MAYSVPDLSYPFDALEPHIDARTMEIHHDKHHAAYVNNLNAALEKHPEFKAGDDVDALMARLDEVPEDIRTAVRNHGGGHSNPTFFWQIMGPGAGGEPRGALGNAITKAFGSFEEFKTQFKAKAVGRFGSGWAWLIADGKGGVALADTPNQDTPLMTGQTPLLGIDVWEHAYYLKYQNLRPSYVDAWWNVVNWTEVSRRFDAARPGNAS